MAIKDYTLDELKSMVLTQVNAIKGLSDEFGTNYSDESYNEAVRECGFELPETDDVDKSKKYQWLIQRMRRWFLFQLWQQYILRFKAGDMEAQQLASNLEKIIKKLDEAFEAAKTAIDTAALFVDSDYIFGTDLVVGPGFIDDRFGETHDDEITNRQD